LKAVVKTKQPEVKQGKGQPMMKTRRPVLTGRHSPYICAIGCSTGGPKALIRLLKSLPQSFNKAILVAQHMEEAFTKGMADWIIEETPFEAVEAMNGDSILPGTIYIAKGSYHMEVSADHKIHLSGEKRGKTFIPSVDILFESVAKVYGSRATGVLLTGMGDDGAKGLLAMKNAMSVTIAQDEATSVIWGMPGEAVKLGAVTKVLSIDHIGIYL
jgi:two-component system chemotaxis response regulator CheB